MAAPPVNGGTEPDQPYDRLIAPYMKNDSLWHCPSDDVPRENTSVWDGAFLANQAPRSYGIVNRLRTREAGEALDPNTGVVGRRLSAVERAAETIALVESWGTFPGGKSDSVLGGGAGSTLLDCDAAKLPGRVYPPANPAETLAPCADWTQAVTPARGHQGFGNYAFADGHVKALRWPQVRGDDFRPFKLKKPAQTFTP